MRMLSTWVGVMRGRSASFYSFFSLVFVLTSPSFCRASYALVGPRDGCCCGPGGGLLYRSSECFACASDRVRSFRDGDAIDALFSPFHFTLSLSVSFRLFFFFFLCVHWTVRSGKYDAFACIFRENSVATRTSFFHFLFFFFFFFFMFF